VGWTNFTQEAIKELAKDPKAKAFVEPYLELDETETEKKPSLVIKPKPHDRLARPDPKAGTGAMFSSGISVLLFLLLYAGNIYAGFEIAIFRNYHPGLVCGIAAAAPILGPVLFLCLPTRLQKSHGEIAAEQMAEHAPEEVQLAYTHPGGHGTPEEEAAAAEAAAAQPKATVYQRARPRSIGASSRPSSPASSAWCRAMPKRTRRFTSNPPAASMWAAASRASSQTSCFSRCKRATPPLM